MISMTSLLFPFKFKLIKNEICWCTTLSLADSEKHEKNKDRENWAMFCSFSLSTLVPDIWLLFWHLWSLSSFNALCNFKEFLTVSCCFGDFYKWLSSAYLWSMIIYSRISWVPFIILDMPYDKFSKQAYQMLRQYSLLCNFVREGKQIGNINLFFLLVVLYRWLALSLCVWFTNFVV